ncbi:hypothetical protein [Nocardia asiatica]
MTPTWYAPILAAAAATTTYFTCVRPMRHRQRAATGVEEQITELTRELNALRAGDDNDKPAARENHSPGPSRRNTDADPDNR